MQIIRPRALTKANFAAFGDVIETANSEHFLINNGNTERYHRLGDVQLSGANDTAIINIFRARSLVMPLQIKMLERHPLGSQAFIPLQQNAFLIVVAEAGPAPAPEQLHAFITDGTQGINYHRGVWHHPILCCADTDDFLVVDRSGPGDNCDEHFFEQSLKIMLDPQRRL